MPTPPPPPRDEQPDQLDLQRLIAAGELDVVAGDPPVPITVWRATDTTDSDPPAAPGRLTARLAGLLVGQYTRVGDLVVDASADPAIAGAAGAGARRYHRVGDPVALVRLHATAGLVVLRWPPDTAAPGRRPRRGQLTMVLTACRRLMTDDGYTVVTLAAIPAGTDYVDHAGQLIPTAHRAGLGYLQHIIAITTPVADLTTHRPDDPVAARVVASTRVHVDLLVLVIRHRHA